MTSEKENPDAQTPAVRRAKPEWRSDFVRETEPAPMKYAPGDLVVFHLGPGETPIWKIADVDIDGDGQLIYQLEKPNGDKYHEWVRAHRLEPTEQRSQTSLQQYQPVQQQDQESQQQDEPTEQQNRANEQHDETPKQRR